MSLKECLEATEGAAQAANDLSSQLLGTPFEHVALPANNKPLEVFQRSDEK